MDFNRLDTTLSYRHRTLRTLPDKLLFAPTGARLFIDYIEAQPGFIGRIDFIHKLNLPGLFGLRTNSVLLNYKESIWKPSCLQVHYSGKNITMCEKKYITWDDIAVAHIQWENTGAKQIELEFFCADGWHSTGQQELLVLEQKGVLHNFCMQAVITSTNGIHRKKQIILPPHTKGEFTICAAVGEKSLDTQESLQTKVALLHDVKIPFLEEHLQWEKTWYSPVPSFYCGEELLEKTWSYRWFLLRHNYAQPNCKNFQHGVFYEGRSHKIMKEVNCVKGHEFTQLIPLSTPLHITDARWKRNAPECKQVVYTLLDSADENGIFRTMKVDETGNAYGNYAVWSVYQMMLTTPDKKFLQEVIGGLKKYVNGLGTTTCQPNDVLPVCFDHRLTGKEYQPSFWYFENFPTTVNGKSSFEQLKRVDLAVYYYLNALGAAELCALIQDADEEKYHALADSIAKAIKERMWDEETGFFYDLRASDDKKAMVKCVTGIYPLWAGIEGIDAPRLLQTFLHDDTFALGSGFATVSKDCPVFTAQGGWNNVFFKGRNGCVWNGPSWPYTTCIALDAIGKAAQSGICDAEVFLKYLKQYSWEHYRQHDLAQPYLVEHYDSITGEMLSDEPDYLHSFFLDLIIKYIAGIEPIQGGVHIAPLKTSLTEFALENITVAGHTVRVLCADGHYQAFVDGKCVFDRSNVGQATKGDVQNGVFVRF